MYEMGKREIFEEMDNLFNVLITYKVYENPEDNEDFINAVLDQILYLKKLLKIFNK